MWFIWGTPNMSTFAARPFVFSTLLHASVAGLLLVVMLRMSRPQPETPHVMEWIPSESLAPAPSTERTAGPARESSVTFKPLPVIVPVREESVAEPVVDEPVRPRTPARPTTTSARTTITEHQRRVVTRTTATALAPAVPSTSRATPSAHININEVLSAGTPATGSGRETPVASDPAREASYWEMLLGKLREAHEKPAGLDDGLKARVEFVLNADGSVGAVRILQSSGNAEFDASVVAAFRRVGDLGAPPAGKVGLNQVTFRTRAD